MKMNRIKELRAELDMTQQELATALGVVRTAISNYEGDRNGLDSQKIRRLCKIFGCTSDYLLCMSSQRTAQISDADAALLAAYYAADPHSREVVDVALRPYFEQETSSASQDAQGGD